MGKNQNKNDICNIKRILSDMGPLTYMAPLEGLIGLSHPLDQDPSWKGSPPPKNWKKISVS